MKLLAIILALVTVSLAASAQEQGLNEDFNEIYSRVPVQEIAELARYYYIYDKDVAEIYDYIITGNFYEAYQFVMAQKEVIEFKDWIGAHLFVDTAMSENLDLDAELYDDDKKPGWNGFMEAFIKIFPFEDIEYLIRQKIAKGGLFAEFFHRLQALRPVYERVIKEPKVLKPLEHLKSLGVNIEQFDQFIRKTLTW